MMEHSPTMPFIHIEFDESPTPMVRHPDEPFDVHVDISFDKGAFRSHDEVWNVLRMMIAGEPDTIFHRDPGNP